MHRLIGNGTFNHYILSGYIFVCSDLGRHSISCNSLLRLVKTDFMFYISSRVCFSPNSGKNCTNPYFPIFLVVFQFSKFLMNMLSTFVLFYSFSNQFMGVHGTRGLTNREFTQIAVARFQGKIAQTWDSGKKVCAIVLLLCNSLRARASV